MKEKTGSRWSPSFVLERIQNKEAGLFHFTDDGNHVAWMVVERIVTEEVCMNIWILEGEGLEHAPEIVPWLDLLAMQIGATCWRLTGRKGWGRVLGLKPVATVFERVLT